MPGVWDVKGAPSVVFWYIKGVGRQHAGEADLLEVGVLRVREEGFNTKKKKGKEKKKNSQNSNNNKQYLSGSLDFKFSIGLQLSETGIPVSKWAIKEAC